VDIEWLPNVQTGIGRVCMGTVVVNDGHVVSRTAEGLGTVLIELIKYLARTGHSMSEAIVKLASSTPDVEGGQRRLDSARHRLGEYQRHCTALVTLGQTCPCSWAHDAAGDVSWLIDRIERLGGGHDAAE
jgi:hypothetical protein